MTPKTKAICQDSVLWPDFHFPYSNTVLSLRSIITASMSTEIIAQIGFPTPFAALWFKCPAMCCSQTARTLRPGAFLLYLPPYTYHLHFPPPVLPPAGRSAGNNYSACFSFEWAVDVGGGFSPHLIYIICASFCLLWSAPLFGPPYATFVYLALLGTFCLCSVCILPRSVLGHWAVPAVVVTQPLNCVLAFVAFSTAFLWLLQLRFSSLKWVSNNITGLKRVFSGKEWCLSGEMLHLIFSLKRFLFPKCQNTAGCELLNNIHCRPTLLHIEIQTNVWPGRDWTHCWNSIQYWSPRSGVSPAETEQ